MRRDRMFRRGVGVASLAVVVGLCVGLGGSGASARAGRVASLKLLGTIVVDPNAAGWSTSSFSLQAGHSYVLVATGSVEVSSTSGDDFDALYGFNRNSGRDAALRIGPATSASPYGHPIDAFQQPTVDESCQPTYCKEGLGYQPSHEYTVDHFYPPSSGRLEVGTGNQFLQQGVPPNYYTKASQFTVKIYSGSASSGGGTGKTARVLSVRGEVNVKHADGTTEALTAATSVRAGDEIQTGVDADAKLEFADHVQWTVPEMTQVLVVDLLDRGSRLKVIVDLKLGEDAAKVNPQKDFQSDFTLKIPTQYPASVRGSAMRVFYDPSTGLEIVAALQDRAYFGPTRRGGKVTTIPAGKEIAVTSGGVVSHLAPIGNAGARGGVDIEKARDLVLAEIDSSISTCHTTAPGTAVTIHPSPRGWTIVVPVRGKATGTSSWQVNAGKVTPINTVAKQIAAGCR